MVSRGRPGSYDPSVTDEELLALLRDAALAVREAVRGFARRGLSGGRRTQYHADVAADAAVLDVLLPAGLTVVSEESGTTPGGPLVCVVDPIDGSTNFDRGVPYYATSLCVLDDDALRCALVVNQAADVWYTATAGGGAFRDGERIAPSQARGFAGSIVSCAGTPLRHPGWAQFRALGAAALELCAVADGSLDGFALVGTAHLNPWDYLGGLLVCREAGAVVEELDGAPLVVASGAPRRIVAAATAEFAAGLRGFVEGPSPS